MVFVFKTYNYDHPWALVNLGIWRKYPNKQCAHVISVDVLDRTIDPKTGIIRTERILGVRQKAPLWVLKLLGGSEHAFVREISFVDPAARRTTLTSVNLSLSQYVTVLEQISYTPSHTHPLARTKFTQSAEIQARLAIWKSLGTQLEKWSAQRFGDNAEKGRVGFEDVLRNLWNRREEVQVQEAHS